jgi:hypothetical protein
VLFFEILLDPCHEMVFKCSFDNLMQDVRCEELVNVGAREVIGERLNVC